MIDNTNNWYDEMTDKEATEIMYRTLSIEERVEYDYTDLVMMEEFSEEMYREDLNNTLVELD